jgi:hypothetical protein
VDTVRPEAVVCVPMRGAVEIACTARNAVCIESITVAMGDAVDIGRVVTARVIKPI